jgi:hypothetical protein
VVVKDNQRNQRQRENVRVERVVVRDNHNHHNQQNVRVERVVVNDYHNRQNVRFVEVPQVRVERVIAVPAYQAPVVERVIVDDGYGNVQRQFERVRNCH